MSSCFSDSVFFSCKIFASFFVETKTKPASRFSIFDQTASVVKTYMANELSLGSQHRVDLLQAHLFAYSILMASIVRIGASILFYLQFFRKHFTLNELLDFDFFLLLLFPLSLSLFSLSLFYL